MMRKRFAATMPAIESAAQSISDAQSPREPTQGAVGAPAPKGSPGLVGKRFDQPEDAQ
ncbi:MAG: hypothetical protein WCF44_09060 [Candidatus Methylophosphatis roskildensis]